MGMDAGSSKGGKKGVAKPSMNVTPLVDVVLVLLIIFMMVTPLLAKQFWVHLPDKKEDPEPPPPEQKQDGPIMITVTAEGDIRINKEVVPDEKFSDKLRRVLAARGDRTVFFDAANSADFGRATEVLDMARGGGAAKVAVLTEQVAGE
jgi:biopolymer transport protein ExbD